MNSRYALALLLTLSACGGGETPTTSPQASASNTAAATVPTADPPVPPAPQIVLFKGTPTGTLLVRFASANEGLNSTEHWHADERDSNLPGIVQYCDC
jgi:hypothetical protein